MHYYYHISQWLSSSSVANGQVQLSITCGGQHLAVCPPLSLCLRYLQNSPRDMARSSKPALFQIGLLSPTILGMCVSVLEFVHVPI